MFRTAAGVALAGLLALAAVMLATLGQDSRARVAGDAALVAHLVAAASPPAMLLLPALPATFDAQLCAYDAAGARITGTLPACAATLDEALANDSFFAPVAAARVPRTARPAAASMPGRGNGSAGRAASTIVVALPDGYLHGALRRLLPWFGLASLLLAAACMLIGLRYSRRLDAEIRRVRDAANAMRAGRGIVPGARPRIAEFAELLGAITDTSIAVRERISDAEREIAERLRAEAALMASENRIRRMIDEVPQAVFAITREGQALLVNQRLATLYDTTPGALLADPSRLLADPWLTSAPTIVIGLGAASRVLEIHRVPFPLAWPSDELTGNGETGTLVVGNDVTEARQLQLQLNQASRMQAIGQLAGGIAHEFNNLLTPINGHAELLRARLQDPELQRPLDAITGAAMRARQLIRQVLSFSRSTEQLFERTPTDIGAVIEEVALLMRGSLPASIEFRVQVERALPLVLADPGQLHQVLVNLCTNAAQAIDGLSAAAAGAAVGASMRRGDPQREQTVGGRAAGIPISGRIGGRIDVIADAIHAEDMPPGFGAAAASQQALAGTKGSELHPSGGHAGDPSHTDRVSGVRIRVLDTGAGMPPEVMARVFDPFFSTKPGDQGTGLGLAVARGIVEAHGGQIRVDASPGWATCFEILLPGALARTGTDITTPAPATVPAASRGRHILLVDDDAAVLLVTGEMLAVLGYEVSTAASGERALELLGDPGRTHVDLVITDNSMPGMDGHTLARRLRAERPSLPIVMLTGLMENDDTADSGVNLQLMKPIGMAELDRALRGLLVSAGAQ